MSSENYSFSLSKLIKQFLNFLSSDYREKPIKKSPGSITTFKFSSCVQIGSWYPNLVTKIFNTYYSHAKMFLDCVNKTYFVTNVYKNNSQEFENFFVHQIKTRKTKLDYFWNVDDFDTEKIQKLEQKNQNNHWIHFSDCKYLTQAIFLNPEQNSHPNSSKKNFPMLEFSNSAQTIKKLDPPIFIFENSESFDSGIEIKQDLTSDSEDSDFGDMYESIEIKIIKISRKLTKWEKRNYAYAKLKGKSWTKLESDVSFEGLKIFYT